MGNMAYCRFENTLADLRDCYDHMDEPLDGRDEVSEFRARQKLIKLCREIALNYGDPDGSD